jgi:hypothetical protein
MILEPRGRTKWLREDWVGMRGVKMEIFRDLYLRGESEQLAALMDEVGKNLPPGWVRDRAIEGQLRALAETTKPTYSFVHKRDNRFPAASIYLREEEPGLLVSANIVPRDKHRLSYGEYNAILEEFCERIVRPYAERRGVHVELTTDQADLNNWLSDKAAEKLRVFSTMAIKDIGCLHPLDHDRWIDFIVAAHDDRSRLDAPTLRRWLTELEGWRPQIADQLVSEYVFGGELLAFSQNRRAGA